MKAKAAFRKIAERIHGRRAVYKVNGVQPPVNYCALNAVTGKWELRRLFDRDGSCKVIGHGLYQRDDYMTSTIQA